MGEREVAAGNEWSGVLSPLVVVGELNRIEVWMGGWGWAPRSRFFSQARGVSRRNLGADQEVAWHLARIGGEECCVPSDLLKGVSDKSQIMYGSQCWTYIVWLS